MAVTVVAMAVEIGFGHLWKDMNEFRLEKQLPIEIVDIILDMLSLSDIIRFSMICKAYFLYITQVYPNYWKLMYRKRWKVLNFCAHCVSCRCDCSDWNTKPERDWKSKYLERLQVEDALTAGGYTLIYQESDVYSKTIVYYLFKRLENCRFHYLV